MKVNTYICIHCIYNTKPYMYICTHTNKYALICIIYLNNTANTIYNINART